MENIMPRPDDNLLECAATVAAVRGPIVRLADRFPERETIDIGIAALYAAHDLAQRAGMTPIEAVEWMRTAADHFERQIMDRPA